MKDKLKYINTFLLGLLTTLILTLTIIIGVGLNKKESIYNIQQYSIDKASFYSEGGNLGDDGISCFPWTHTIYKASIDFEIDWDREIIRTTSFKYKSDSLTYQGPKEENNTTYDYDDSWQTFHKTFNTLVDVSLSYGIKEKPNIEVILDTNVRTVWYDKWDLTTKEKTRTLLS